MVDHCLKQMFIVAQYFIAIESGNHLPYIQPPLGSGPLPKGG